MKVFCAIFCSLFLSFAGLSQEPDRINVLNRELASSEGVERMNILGELSMFYADTLSEKALGFAAQYLKLSQLYGSLQDELKAYTVLSTIYQYQVRYEEAKKYSLNALRLSIALNDKERTATNFYKAGYFYLFLHDFDSATYYTDLALQSFLNLNDSIRIFSVLVQKGKIYCSANDNEKAKEVFDELLPKLKKAGLPAVIPQQKTVTDKPL